MDDKKYTESANEIVDKIKKEFKEKTMSDNDKFIELLKQYGLKDDEKLFVLLIQYFNRMDQHMGAITQELSNIKDELSKIQDKTIKSEAEKTANTFESTIHDVKNQFYKIKDDINIAVKSGIEQSELCGKEGIVTAVKAMRIKEAMQGLKSLNERLINGCDKMFDKLTEFANESHRAFEHVKNAGKSIVGKEIEEPGNHNFDKGIIAGMQKFLFKIMEVSTNLNQKLDNAINDIENYDQMVELERSSNKSIHERIEKAKEAKQQMQDEQQKDMPAHDISVVKDLNPAR